MSTTSCERMALLFPIVECNLKFEAAKDGYNQPAGELVRLPWWKFFKPGSCSSSAVPIVPACGSPVRRWCTCRICSTSPQSFRSLGRALQKIRQLAVAGPVEFRQAEISQGSSPSVWGRISCISQSGVLLEAELYMALSHAVYSATLQS